jgi:hypothetical protein
VALPHATDRFGLPADRLILSVRYRGGGSSEVRATGAGASGFDAKTLPTQLRSGSAARSDAAVHHRRTVGFDRRHILVAIRSGFGLRVPLRTGGVMMPTVRTRAMAMRARRVVAGRSLGMRMLRHKAARRGQRNRNQDDQDFALEGLHRQIYTSGARRTPAAFRPFEPRPKKAGARCTNHT